MHPIVERLSKALSMAYVLTETFEADTGRPPTREECALAATLYIEANKERAKAKVLGRAAVADAPTGSNPRLEDLPEGCPQCGGEMWDNRADKKSPRSPDFKCKDKACDTPIWLTPPPPGTAAPKKPQTPIAEPEDPFDW